MANTSLICQYKLVCLPGSKTEIEEAQLTNFSRFISKLIREALSKTFRRMKKLHDSIDLDLAKYLLISQRKFSFELFWKILNLKIKISQLGSKSSSNTLIRKRIRTGEETSTIKFQGTTQLSITGIQWHFSYPSIPHYQAYALNWFPKITFLQPHQQQTDWLRFIKTSPLVK